MGVLEAINLGPLDNNWNFLCLHWFCGIGS